MANGESKNNALPPAFRLPPSSFCRCTSSRSDEVLQRQFVQALRPVAGDAQEIAELDAGALVVRHDVGLHHDAHVLLETKRRLGDAALRLARAGAGRQQADAEAVKKAVEIGRAHV